jgi:hypothetical protein
MSTLETAARSDAAGAVQAISETQIAIVRVCVKSR